MHEHVRREGDRRALAAALVLVAAFVGLEVVAGLLADSLALLADAGHMLSDTGTLALALFAAWVARRPATPSRSFGYRRAEILAALVNGLALVAVAVWIFVEAARRLGDPGEPLGGWMLAVGALGLAVVVAGAAILVPGWAYADPVVSVVIGVLVLASSWTILRDSTHVLLEATPRGLDAEEVGRALAAHPGVREVHDLHVW